MSTALVLGAGGLVGQAYHLGVLSALHDSGFDGRDADVLVGTSAGSLVAAALAGGLSAPDLAAELLGRPMSEQGRRTRAAGRGAALHLPEAPAPAPGRGPLAPGALLAAARRPFSTRPGAVLAGLLPAGRLSTEGIARGVQRLHPGGWPARDLRVCAVRARDARRVVFGGPGGGPAEVGRAVAASCAIPGWFTPVTLDGETYVDGGAHSPTNADVVLRDRPDLVVVVSPMSAARVGLRADTGLRLASAGLLTAEVLRLRTAGCRVVVVQPGTQDLSVMGTNAMRRDGLEQVLHRAARSTSELLAQRPRLLQVS